MCLANNKRSTKSNQNICALEKSTLTVEREADFKILDENHTHKLRETVNVNDVQDEPQPQLYSTHHDTKFQSMLVPIYSTKQLMSR